MATTMHSLIPALVALPLASLSPRGGEGKSWTLPVKPEEPGGYAANPSTLKLPLRQDLTSLRIERLENGHFNLSLQGGAAPLALSEIDLGLLLPRVPAYARGNED